MTEAPSSSRWTRLLAGRWQIPVALLACAIGGGALLNLAPRAPAPIELDAVLADIAQLETTGDTLGAATAIQDILASDPRALEPDTKAGLHERLADLLYRSELRRREHSASNLELLVENLKAAETLGRHPSPEGAARSALAELWLGRADEAIPHLIPLLSAELSPETRDAIVAALVDAVQERTLAPDEDRDLLNELLEMPQLGAAVAWWAIHTAVDRALEQGDTAAARDVVENFGDALSSSDLEGYRRHLDAVVAFAEGRVDDAYPGAWWVEAWIPHRPRDAEALDRYASLPALNRLTLGQAQLANGEPSAALESFDYVLTLRPGPALRTNAVLGQCRALADLDRHDGARAAVREGLAAFTEGSEARRLAASAARMLLMQLQDTRRELGDRDNAIGYLRLALELTPTDDETARREALELIASNAAAAAGNAHDTPAARVYHTVAGEALAAVADLAETEEAARADRIWEAAQHFDTAGELTQALPLLERFLEGRAADPRAPQALLLLGQTNEGLGRLSEALHWYERLARDHDAIDVAEMARVRSARTLISMGPEHFAEAERRLVDLMSEGRVSPVAALYRDALLTLCELLEAEGRDAAAIARFEEFQRLYPEDARNTYVQVRIANAYRRSALELRRTAPDDAAGDGARAEASTRLEQAATAYARVLESLQGAPADPTNDELMRLSMLYRADCLHDLGTTESLKAALAQYQAIATRLEGTPAALTAYVQIARVQLRQGELAAAARSLERARWLLKGLPDSAFGPDPQRERSEWEQFFEVTLSSTLFQGALASR